VSAGGALVVAVAAAAGAFVSSASKLDQLQAASIASIHNVFFIISSLVGFVSFRFLDGFFSFFLGSNANRLFHIGEKDLAVADLSGLGCFDDHVDCCFGLVVWNNHFDL